MRHFTHVACVSDLTKRGRASSPWKPVSQLSVHHPTWGRFIVSVPSFKFLFTNVLIFNFPFLLSPREPILRTALIVLRHAPSTLHLWLFPISLSSSIRNAIQYFNALCLHCLLIPIAHHLICFYPLAHANFASDSELEIQSSNILVPYRFYPLHFILYYVCK